MLPVSTYNSLAISADTGLDPPVLDSAGDPCLPIAKRPGLTEGGDDPRREFNACDVSGLLPLALVGGVTLSNKAKNILAH